MGGSSISASGIGNIRLHITETTYIVLQDVLYIPQATVCLVSVSHMSSDLQTVLHFDDKTCWLTDKISGTVIAQGFLTSQRLYALNLVPPKVEHALVAMAKPTIETWHCCLGHTNYQAISDMSKKDMVLGMSFDPSSVPPKCQSCVTGKQTQSPVPKARQEGQRAAKRLEIVWVDLSGPHDVTSHKGNKYILNLVDDATSFPWSIPTTLKDVAYSELKIWELAREQETGSKVGTYRTDNGELKSKAMDEWLWSQGTRQEFMAPYTSAHNGRVECIHRTLMNKARKMQIYADLPPYLWDEFYLTASYLHAQTTTHSLNGSTPFMQWYKKKPDLSHLHEISCKAFVLIQDRNNPKIYERSIECTLISYELNAKAYRCYHRTSRKIITSYHVSFIESHQVALSPPHVNPPISPLTQTPLDSTPVAITTVPDLSGYDSDDDPVEHVNIPNNNHPDNPLHTQQPRQSAQICNPTNKACDDELPCQS